jgi:hypothetical protein
MGVPGFRLHPLKGDLKGYWAVTVRANPLRRRFDDADEESPHPGGFVLRECIEPLGLTITDAAAALGVTRTTLSELVNGKCGISP